MQIIKDITLDFYNNDNVCVRAKAGDNGRFVRCSITDNGTQYPIPENAAAYIACGNTWQMCRIADNKVLAPLTPPMLSAGIKKCQVELMSAQDKLTSMSFTLLVEESARNDGAAEGDPRLSLVDELLQESRETAKQVQELEEEIQTKLESGAFKGEKGDTGAKGDKGDQGQKGDKGNVGPVGPTGETGPIGPTGNTGPAGPTGPSGEKGDKGGRGEKGERGDTGATGARGLPGETGAKGEKGDKGDTGPQGPAGPKGDDGIVSSIDMGMFAMLVRDGHLYMLTDDGQTPPPLKILDGRLKYVIEEV